MTTELLVKKNETETEVSEVVERKFDGGICFLEPAGRGSWADYAFYICSCGEKFKGSRHPKPDTKCRNEDCKNSGFRFIARPPKDRKTVIGGVFDAIEVTNYSFIVEKTDVVAHIKVGIDNDRACYSATPEHYSVTYTFGAVYRIDFSLKDKRFDVYKDGVLLPEDKKSSFTMGDLHYPKFIEAISTDQNKPLYEFAFRTFGKKYNERTNKIDRVLKSLMDRPYLEVLNNCGLSTLLNYAYHHTQRDDNGNFHTKPHEILGVPKFMMPYFRNYDASRHMSRYNIERLNQVSKVITPNSLKIMMEIFHEESNIGELINNSDYILQLYRDYGYQDIRRLSLYLAREVKLEQGIVSVSSACNLLRDYSRMCIEANLTFNRYSKSLKKDHDITTMNYNVKKDHVQNDKFMTVVEKEDYQSLIYEPKKKMYVIHAPKQSYDLVNEGTSLSHCVKSYVDDVIRGKCKIYFLRLSDAPEESLVTIEVRDGNIRQVRGKNNRPPIAEEKDFVQEWAKDKELHYGVY